MAASTSRKNGKQASCEPCRRGKVRCDHNIPICDRCRRRNMDSECWYHPAPLTRPSKRTRTPSLGNLAVDSSVVSGETSPVATVPSYDNNRVGVGVRWNDHDNRLHPVCDANTTSPATLPLLSLQSLDNTSARYIPSTAVYDDRGNETLEGDLLSIIKILEHLQHFGIISKLVLEYYRLGQTAAVPSQLVLPVLSDLQQLHEDILHRRVTTDHTANRVAISAMAQRILHATKSKSPITPSTSLAEFTSFYSETNLRVETIGLIFAIAARASRLGLVPDGENSHDFVQAMFQCSARCLRLARELALEMNDVIVWLSYENLRLTTSIQGYASPNVWRRLGDLSTDIFALEIHREAAIQKTPFFLAECRRRIYAAAFHWDKFLATLFDRPPRIPSYYADCRLPLELDDDQLCLTGLSDEEQAAFEREDGWSTGSSSCSPTWIRALYLLATFKEETLLHQLKPLDHETRSKLEEIASRCKETWKQFPSRVHYSSACWKSNMAPISCLRLAEIYLTYLQTLLHIYRLLEKRDGSYSPDLVQTCSSIIETTLQINGGFQNQAVYHLHHSFRASIVLCYGLPSAITLINALKTARRTASRAQFADLVRLVSIRRLSVFVTFLEGVYRPENANYALCIKASGLISGALDEVIEYLLLLAADDTTQQSGSEVTSNVITGTEDLLVNDGLAGEGQADKMSGDLNLIDWDAADLMDMNNWMEGIDWTNASGGV